MNKNFGQVYKVHSNKYFVKFCDKVVECNARGLLKRNKCEILVGDYVEMENNTIISVSDRKNRFIRPNVSNVDIVVAVISSQPKPDLYLVDKLFINALKEKADFCLVVNKSDIDASTFDEISDEYKDLGINILSVSSKTGEGIDLLKKILYNKFAVLAGQSAVGKTSITNSLFNLQLKTGDLSEKIERGKHTTTRSEIFEFDNIKIIDSPGFAVIDANIEADELSLYYPEFVDALNECKYRSCLHINEPSCKVKQLVDDGKINKARYQRYVEIYNELHNRRNKYEKN